MKAPLVSAVIPTYERSEFLQRAVISVIDQSYSNIEIIIVDDNDGDNEYRKNTKDNILPLLQKCERPYKYLEHDYNRGLPSARNTGIKEAKGEYIAFLDDDDQWLPNKTKLQVELFQKLPEIYGVVSCGWEITHELNKYTKVRYPNKMGNLNGYLGVNHFSPPSMVMVKKTALTKVNGFDESFRSREDVELYCRLSEFYLFDYVQEVLVKYLLHNDSMSTNHTEKIASIYKYFDKHKQNLLSESRSELYEMLGELEIVEGQRLHGIRNLTKALALKPRRYQVYVKIILSFLGSAMYRSIRKM